MISLVSCGLIAAAVVALCLLFKSDHDHSRWLVLVAVVLGLVLVEVPVLHPAITAVGRPLIELTQMVAWFFAPTAAVIALVYVTLRFTRRWWRQYPDRPAPARVGVVLALAGLGFFAAVLLRAEPFVSDAVDVFSTASRVGLREALAAAIDQLSNHVSP